MKKQALKVKTFASCGDRSNIEQYLSQAQEINQLLLDAEDTVEGFNVEETAFEWELTSYPLRLELINELKPYIQLYSSGVDFERKRK